MGLGALLVAVAGFIFMPLTEKNQEQNTEPSTTTTTRAPSRVWAAVESNPVPAAIPQPTTSTVYVTPPSSTTPLATTSSTGGPAIAAGTRDWDAVAQCESGGDWHINTGNGYYGGLQMDMQFWRSYGEGMAPRPDLASREQQIRAAENAYRVRGARPWPHCGKYL